MPLIDNEAALRLTRLRAERGLSPEGLAEEIRKWAAAQGPAWTRGVVDASTIRRIEGDPLRGKPCFVPKLRVAFVIAAFFGKRPDQIWKPGRAVMVSTEQRYRQKVAA